METRRRASKPGVLDQVPDTIYYHSKIQMTEVTLFADNADFKTRGTDLLQSIRKHFKRRISVHNTLAYTSGPNPGRFEL